MAAREGGSSRRRRTGNRRDAAAGAGAARWWRHAKRAEVGPWPVGRYDRSAGTTRAHDDERSEETA
ncbi:hypothetical protein [Plantactinospora sp. WMMB782]|uniref:hypothetical protein n=1 Tax=Plantactinospora sp. WMMB782 TaxID=3404121 RepID=UPI003B932C44